MSASRPILSLFLLTASLTLIMLIGGCSFATRFAYNHADWLVYRKLDPFLNLNDAQRSEYDQRFEAAWRWHRREELPRYADYLESLAARLADNSKPMAAEEIRQEGERLRSLLERSSQRILPDAVVILRSLSDRQVQQFVEEIKAKDEDFAEEFLDIGDAERVEKYREWTEDRVDDWLGHVNDRQQQLLTEWAATRRTAPAARHAWRESRRRRIGLVLQARHEPGFADELRGMLEAPRADQPEELQSIVEHNHALWFALLGEILKASTAEQREHAIDKLQDYADDFSKLARREIDDD